MLFLLFPCVLGRSLLFAEGGGRVRAESELQSAAWGGGERRSSEEPQYSHASAHPAVGAISE